MKKNLAIYILVFVLINSENALLSEKIETTNKFRHIREMIDHKNIEEAEIEIEKLSEKESNDPTLQLYQTEVWIEKGEESYRLKNFRKAFDYFRKANNTWPFHPLVKKRYWELKNRSLKSENASNMPNTGRKDNVKSEEKSHRKKIVHVIEIESDSDEIISILSEIRKDIKALKDRDSQSQVAIHDKDIVISKKILYTIAGIIPFFVLGIYYFIKRVKKNRKT